ncbi:N-acetylmuramoyl-L-alanine amidase [Plectonema cf. radiosum LEGE 06105]|uniref:N-acetylmuramoyl-L-alanine amidase n=1 Tax=Plectonema cf. radiosum LEGE 06105 TaxID=945769 RepID=A0A8J7FE07_9CYAN|nr:N-acetylmuramoyl-L-alanine amidase [Plectonema cf. radiosum LEGE 06105]
MKPILGLAISSIFICSPASAIVQLQPLSGVKILVNPGHGGQETGAAGPTGYLAKDVSLSVSKLLRDQLVLRGAIVVMTREDDIELSLSDRQAMIDREEPTIAITIHYTAVPDDGDAENSKGIRTFWYHSQAHSLAVFLHNYLVNQLGRSSMGVFWNNLALTRPSTAPSVVMELGFMTNPEEFEWIANTDEQKKLARVLADAIVEWFQNQITP